MIRARQLKRVLMMLVSKSTIPTEVAEMKVLANEVNDIVSWKVMTKMDTIEKNRMLVAEQDRMKRLKLEAHNG